MIKLLILLALAKANPADIYTYEPKHLMQTDGLSCGAGDRFLKERLKVELGTRSVKVNNMQWDFQGLDDDGNISAVYQTHPDQYTKLHIIFGPYDAILTLTSIDYKRRPCTDAVYLQTRFNY